MKTMILALTLGVALLACSTSQQPPSTAASGAGPVEMTAMDFKACSMFRADMDHGRDNYVQDSCNRQLGEMACRRCLDEIPSPP